MFGTAEENLASRLSENVREVRVVRNLSQKELAERIGLHQSYVGSIERGEKQLSALQTLEKLAKGLEVEPPRLLLGPTSELLEKIHREAGENENPATGMQAGDGSGAPSEESLEKYLKVSGEKPDEEGDEQEVIERQSPDEMEQVLSNHLSKRGVSNNRLIGKADGEQSGVILLPPYRCTVDESDNMCRVTIEGSSMSPDDSVWDGDTKWSTRCHKVVASRYRGNALIFYQDTGEEPTRDILVPLQQSRAEMLASVPPGEKLSKRAFLYHENNVKEDETAQSDAPRRWRELRNEFGFDVWEEGGDYYRGDTVPPVKKPNPRPDMSALNRKYWDDLYERHDGECNICGRSVRYDEDEDGLYGLIDHRIPVLYGGSDEKENLQLACQECNNLKKKLFKRSPERYLSKNKSLAYPENYEQFFVQLTGEEGAMIREIAESKDEPPRAFAGRLLGAAARMYSSSTDE